jgi:hypothetical protein
MANFNLIGQNLRGLTVTFTFKDMNPYPDYAIGDTHTVLSVLDGEYDDGLSVKASRVPGNSYGYYDDVQEDTDGYLSVDSYQLSPITYTFSDDEDFIVTAYDPNYVSCDLTEEDLYTTISGKWEITNPYNLTIATSLTEQVNFTSNTSTYTHMYMVYRGYTWVEYHNIVDGEYENISTIIYTNSEGLPAFNESYAVIDFGTEPQKVSQHFVRCLSMIANPVVMATIKGKWMFTENAIVTDFNGTESVNFISSGTSFTQMCIEVTGSNFDVIFHDPTASLGQDAFYVITGTSGTLNLPEFALVDFGETEQTVSSEFLAAMKKLAICVSDKKISGAWKLKGARTNTPAENDVEESVKFKSNGTDFVKVIFMDSNVSGVSNIVVYQTSTLRDYCAIDGSNTYPEYFVMDFGEDEQDVSEDFLIWLAHMAYRVEEVSGMWTFIENGIDTSMFVPSMDLIEVLYERVDFKTEFGPCQYLSVVVEGEGRYLEMSYFGDNELEALRALDGQCAWGGDGGLNEYRYLQFGNTQYVSPLLKEFLEANATELGDGALEPGEYCFKLDPYDAVKEFAGSGSDRNISVRYTFARPNADGSDPDEQYNIYVGGAGSPCYVAMDLANGWSCATNTPAQFRAFGWWQNGYSTFQNRHINVLEKTYLTYDEYQFLNKVLIPLNSKRLLDTLGVWETAQSLKTMTDLTIKYAKYMKYTPVADVLYHDETNGTTSVTGLNLSNYLYVTIKARASGTFVRPTSTSFAVKTITDCGGSFQLQIADNKYYMNYVVTNNSITTSSATNSSSYKIYEVIGYRWEAALDTIPEEDTPTYAYQYVRGQLSCPSGKYFNNFYNYDQGTEFRVELNFRLTSLGVELASNTASANNNWKLSVNENGNLVMNNTYDGTAATPAVWTEFTIQPNVWYSLSLYSNNLTSTNYTSTKGQVNVSIVSFSTNPSHSYVMKKINKWSQFSTTRSLYVGGDNVELRNRILIKGTKYHSGVTNTQSVIDVDVDNATIGGTLSLTSGSFTLSGGLVYSAEE